MDAARLAVQHAPRTLPAYRQIGLAECWERADPDFNNAPLLESYQIAPEPIAAHVVFCAVDRIDNPAATGNSFTVGALFAE